MHCVAGLDVPTSGRARVAGLEVADGLQAVKRKVGYMSQRFTMYDDLSVAEIELCIAEQLAEFRNLYGREPSHFDGHQHIHQSLGVLAARTIPTAAKMRPSLTFSPGEKWWPNRAYRSLLNRALRTRFRAPRYLFSIADMHPALGGSALEEKLALSSGSAVEVMTHPAWDDELAVLLDPRWTALIGQRRVGSYEQL